MTILQPGTDYDFACESIRCHADKVGARVYDITRNGYTVSILAHSEALANARADALTEDELTEIFGV